MIYRKLKRTWTQGYANYMHSFSEAFPELSRVDKEELADRFRKLGLEFYTEERVPVSFWIRLTLPFGLLAISLMFMGLPINFIITGNWGYSISKKGRVLNWLRSLRLQ